MRIRPPQARRRARPVAALAAIAFLLGACGASASPGGTVRISASPSVTAASAAASATALPSSSAPSSPAPSPSGSPAMSTAPFGLSSSAFAAGASIPSRYTCDGRDVSPPLAWTGAPAGTAAFLLVVDDPDANGFVHWVVADLPATAASLPEGASGHVAPAVEGRNGFGRIGWGGPCPPSGTHHYRFTLVALSAPLGLARGLTAAQARTAAAGKSIGQAELVATYHR